VRRNDYRSLRRESLSTRAQRLQRAAETGLWTRVYEQCLCSLGIGHFGLLSSLQTNSLDRADLHEAFVTTSLVSNPSFSNALIKTCCATFSCSPWLLTKMDESKEVEGRKEGRREARSDGAR
jgi:hypothetical protein